MQRHLLALSAAVAVLAAAPLAAHAAPLLVNGSFEGLPADTNPSEHYARGVAPEGWSAVDGYEVPDIVSAGYTQGAPPFLVLLTAQDGDRFLDTNGFTPVGGLFQDIEGLAAGSAVSLSYWYGQWAQNSAGILDISLIDLTDNHVIDADHLDIGFHNTVTTSSWINATLGGVVGTSGKVRVKFTADSGAYDRGGIGLDNLSLTGTLASTAPEPAAWAMMLTGFGLAGAILRRRGRDRGLGAPLGA